MQTIINIIQRIGKHDNLILLLSDIRHLDTRYINEDEFNFVKKYHKEFKRNEFVFNRLNQFVFLNIAEKEPSDALRLENYRIAGAMLSKQINDYKINRVVVVDSENKPQGSLAFAEGMALANYQFLKYKKDPSEKLNTLNSIDIFSNGIKDAAIDQLNILIDATNRCRDFVNEPVAFLNAEKFADEIALLGKKSGAHVEILSRKKIEALKMGGLLAVNKGSVDPPTFTIVEWKPENAVNKKPFVMTGKGVVYDTGGMNIKTSDYMNNMKMDMAGGAAVASVVYAAALARIPLYVIGLIPATDNRLNGNAYVNGDILTMHDGTRVEVVNTDAEGRLILADALSYAKKFDPLLVVNIATLTGAAARAIGKYGIVAMQSKAKKEMETLKLSGENVGERLVEFPLWKEYGELIKSEVADIKNVGGMEGGAITAGKFLEHFTGYPFIHLDIAGPAFLEKPYNYFPAGATGITVRLLFDFLKKNAELMQSTGGRNKKVLSK